MLDLQPKKLPRQARAQATFDAIVEACAQLLREAGYGSVTTNRVAERAGVSIGSLYEFFPNKESIVAVLVERQVNRTVDEAAKRLEAALAFDNDATAGEHLIRGIVDLVASDRELFRVMLRDVPFTAQLPAVQRAVDRALDLARVGAQRAIGRMNLPDPDADIWLIGRMLHHTILEIAFASTGAPARGVLTRELVRLTFRMVLGKDVGAAPRPQGARPAVRAKRPS